MLTDDSVERERLQNKWRGESNGVEILGHGIPITSGSIHLEQVEGPPFGFDRREGEASVDADMFRGMAGSYSDFFLMASIFFVMY